MAKKAKSRRRVEPHFGDAKSNGRGTSRSRSTKKSGTTRRKSKRKSSGLGRLFGFVPRLAYWGLVMGLWGGIGAVALIGYYAAQLPQSTTWSVPKRPPNVKILAADGKLLANRGITGGEAVSLARMSPYIPQAVIAIEDHRFHSHFGIDPIGFVRAMSANLFAGRLVQGGSSISQQLAKNLFLKPERTLRRKVQELVLAFWLEASFSKDEILEMYLNRVYFGSGSYGVAAASRRYFGKVPRDINLAEAATLAGVLKAPSRLSPARNPEKAEERAQIVLAAMRREGFISDREVAKALSTPASNAKHYWSGSQHYVADHVMNRLEELVGDVNEDIVVRTTIDQSLQSSAETALRHVLDRESRKRNVSQGAIVSLTGSGAISAIVGGRDYSASQFNRALDAKRQPGSAFKPFVFLASLEQGNSPETIRHDGPIRIGKWRPENYLRKYRGPVSLQKAMEESINTVAAQLAMEAGPRRVAKTARRLGITSKLNVNASIALGTSEVSLLELTSAYVPLANGGYRARPYLIRSVKSASGKVLFQRKTPGARRVIKDRELIMLDTMLAGVVANGTGKLAYLNDQRVAGKTGTSQSFRDGWFIGYVPGRATGVWLGNDNGQSTKKVTGGSLPAEIWATTMSGGATESEEVVPQSNEGFAVLPAKVPVPRRRPTDLDRNVIARLEQRERHEPAKKSITTLIKSRKEPPKPVGFRPIPKVDVGRP
ncbi:MAG: PBP1A family penicillin-binding protein [Pseudomonadota bacterium]